MVWWWWWCESKTSVKKQQAFKKINIQFITINNGRMYFFSFTFCLWFQKFHRNHTIKRLIVESEIIGTIKIGKVVVFYLAQMTGP